LQNERGGVEKRGLRPEQVKRNLSRGSASNRTYCPPQKGGKEMRVEKEESTKTTEGKQPQAKHFRVGGGQQQGPWTGKLEKRRTLTWGGKEELGKDLGSYTQRNEEHKGRWSCGLKNQAIRVARWENEEKQENSAALVLGAEPSKTVEGNDAGESRRKGKG